MGFIDKFFGPTIAAAITGVKDDIVGAVKSEIEKYAPTLMGVAVAQFDKYFPQLLALAKDELQKYGPQLMDMAKTELHDQFEQWMPILMTGLSKSAVDTAVKLADHGIDDLARLTPTELDDKFVAPIAKGLVDWLGQVFSGALLPPPGALTPPPS